MKYTFTLTKVIDDKDHDITKLINGNPLTNDLKNEILEDLLDSNDFFNDIEIDLVSTMNTNFRNSMINSLKRELNECHNLLDLYQSRLEEYEPKSVNKK